MKVSTPQTQSLNPFEESTNPFETESEEELSASEESKVLVHVITTFLYLNAWLVIGCDGIIYIELFSDDDGNNWTNIFDNFTGTCEASRISIHWNNIKVFWTTP